VEVLYAVDLTGGVDSEWDAIKTLAADDAHKARRVERLARRTQNL